MRGATILLLIIAAIRCISIHAPREGSDAPVALVASCEVEISIHAPREGSDVYSIRGWITIGISIHAPREGSDGKSPLPDDGMMPFLSTLPVRGATRFRPCIPPFWWISIHAPREGSDSRPSSCSTCSSDFYPRSP